MGVIESSELRWVGWMALRSISSWPRSTGSAGRWRPRGCRRGGAAPAGRRACPWRAAAWGWRPPSPPGSRPGTPCACALPRRGRTPPGRASRSDASRGPGSAASRGRGGARRPARARRRPPTPPPAPWRRRSGMSAGPGRAAAPPAALGLLLLDERPHALIEEPEVVQATEVLEHGGVDRLAARDRVRDDRADDLPLAHHDVLGGAELAQRHVVVHRHPQLGAAGRAAQGEAEGEPLVILRGRRVGVAGRLGRRGHVAVDGGAWGRRRRPRAPAASGAASSPMREAAQDDAPDERRAARWRPAARGRARGRPRPSPRTPGASRRAARRGSARTSAAARPARRRPPAACLQGWAEPSAGQPGPTSHPAWRRLAATSPVRTGERRRRHAGRQGT